MIQANKYTQHKADGTTTHRWAPELDNRLPNLRTTHHYSHEQETLATIIVFSLCLVGVACPSEAGRPAPHSCLATHITCTIVCVYSWVGGGEEGGGVGRERWERGNG